MASKDKTKPSRDKAKSESSWNEIKLSDNKIELRKLCIKNFDSFHIYDFFEHSIIKDIDFYYQKPKAKKPNPKNPDAVEKSPLAFNDNDYKLFFKSNKNYQVELIERLTYMLNYMQFLLTEENTYDSDELAVKVSDILNIDPKQKNRDMSNYLFQAVQKDMDCARSLIPDNDARHKFDDFVKLLQFCKKHTFVLGSAYNNIPSFLNKNKELLSILDYYFDCWVNIDVSPRYFFTDYLVGLYELNVNETQHQRDLFIKESTEKIYDKACELLKTETVRPSIKAINKLPSLLKLSQLTEKEYDNIKALYKKPKPSEILNSLTAKVNRYEAICEKKLQGFKSYFSSGATFDDLFSSLNAGTYSEDLLFSLSAGDSFEDIFFSIYKFLDYKYFKLFKILVPFSLLSNEKQIELREYLFNEFNLKNLNAPPFKIPLLHDESSDWPSP